MRNSDTKTKLRWEGAHNYRQQCQMIQRQRLNGDTGTRATTLIVQWIWMQLAVLDVRSGFIISLVYLLDKRKSRCKSRHETTDAKSKYKFE